MVTGTGCFLGWTAESFGNPHNAVFGEKSSMEEELGYAVKAACPDHVSLSGIDFRRHRVKRSFEDQNR